MSDLSEIARETSFINYTQLSANLLCFYDLLITFDMEVNRIWPSRFTAMKCLFFINRYHRLPKLIIDAIYTYAPTARFNTSCV
ncbi:hypothetical protein C8Q75DRAFT_470251 [Abortiporus biennis]|nr:hypothetical protein C8Q75DRAFT_470251 [Abortiporus biennis]